MLAYITSTMDPSWEMMLPDALNRADLKFFAHGFRTSSSLTVSLTARTVSCGNFWWFLVEILGHSTGEMGENGLNDITWWLIPRIVSGL